MNVRPKKLTRHIPLRVTPDTWKALTQVAKGLETNPTAVIRIALRDFFQRCDIKIADDV